MGQKRKRNRLKNIKRIESRKRPTIPGSVLKTVAFFVGLIGLISSLVTFLPRLSLAQYPESNPESDLSLKFQLSNDSVIALHDVTYRFWIPVVFGKVPDRNPPSKTALEDSIEKKPIVKLGTLDPSEKITFSSLGFTQLDPNDDVTIVIEFEFSYRPAFTFWRLHKRMRMVSIIDKDGRTSWVPHPLGDVSYLGRGRPVVHEFPVPFKFPPGSGQIIYDLETGRVLTNKILRASPFY